MHHALHHWRAWLPLALIIGIGAGLRFYRIGVLPPGLYRDEGFYGLDALHILDAVTGSADWGGLPVYFAANNGREGLFIYLLAASVGLFGRTPEALRITSAVVGVLTLFAIYFAGRNMFSHRVGVLSTAILALNFWHLAISRVAFRAITLPLVLCVMMAFIFAALRTNDLRPRLVYSVLAGVVFGLTFYTYTSAQFTLPLVALYGLSLWIGLRRELFVRHSEESRYRRRMSAIAFSAAALLVLAPLLLWLPQHADLYFGRAGQVSILNPDINEGDLAGALMNNVARAAGMFAIQGDRIWRHNLSLRPVFDGWLVLAFALGLIVCAWRWLRSWQSRFGAEILGVETNVAPQFVLLWLAMFLLPTILAEDTPHFLRAIGALPAACIIAAVGLESGLAWLSRRGVFAGLTLFLRRVVSPPAFVAALLLVLSGVNTVSDYFNDYVNRTLTRYWLEDHNVQLARVIDRYARTIPPSNIWLEDRLANDNPSLTFLSGERWTVVTRDAKRTTDGQPLTSISLLSPSVLLIVDPNHDWSSLRSSLPPSATLRVLEGPLAQGDEDPAPRRAFIGVLAAPAEPDVGAAQAREVLFEGGIVLEAANVQPAVEPTNLYTVTLTWRVTQPITEDYAVFVHWLRNGQPQPLVQSDSSPAGGFLPMPAWRVGDRVVDEHGLAAPGGAQSGDVIHIGVYRREGNQRLRVLDTAGNPKGDSVIIQPPRQRSNGMRERERVT